MKCTIPEISWHNREPVLSLAIHPVNENFYRLATGGADCHVLIWKLNICDNGAVKVDALSDLTRHQKAINSVRWSPTGQYLATADDDANIIIWQLKTDNIPLLEGETKDEETWIVHKIMRGHKEDIYDLAWSPTGLKLISGSIDNTAILWDFNKGKMEHILTDHKGFVQGVSWDPKNQYVATMGTDRICRIFDTSGKHVRARIHKGLLPVPDTHYLHNKEVKYFHDDTFKSFFRRLNFSIDGTLLVVPSGHIVVEDTKKILNVTYIFVVDLWTSPAAMLPSGDQSSTVACFCPILFELREDGPEPTIKLPYRMIIAVGTDHDVILYDTQQLIPFAYFRNMHYTRLTDLSWSNDGLLLMASSTDGFCALITFEPEELGVQYIKEDDVLEESLNISGCEEFEKEEQKCGPPKEKEKELPIRPKKPSLLDKWTIKTPKKDSGGKIRPKDTESKIENKANDEAQKNSDIVKSQQHITGTEINKQTVNRLIPKRIKPIPVKQTKSNDTAKSVLTSTNKSLVTVPISDKKSKEPETKTQSPLLSFLKLTPKHNSKTNSPETLSTKPEIILDENEARDSWKCDKEKKTPQPPPAQCEPITIDDSTEEFSLHLEDTNNTQSNTFPQQPTNKLTNQDHVSRESGACVVEQSHAQNKDSNKLDIGNSQNIAICKNESELIAAKESKQDNALNKVDCIQNPENRVKRRIPLITLSSPKQKKK